MIRFIIIIAVAIACSCVIMSHKQYNAAREQTLWLGYSYGVVAAADLQSNYDTLWRPLNTRATRALDSLDSLWRERKEK